MTWLILGTVAAVSSIIGVVWFTMRREPVPVDYPAEHGDGEG